MNETSLITAYNHLKKLCNGVIPAETYPIQKYSIPSSEYLYTYFGLPTFASAILDSATLEDSKQLLGNIPDSDLKNSIRKVLVDTEVWMGEQEEELEHALNAIDRLDLYDFLQRHLPILSIDNAIKCFLLNHNNNDSIVILAVMLSFLYADCDNDDIDDSIYYTIRELIILSPFHCEEDIKRLNHFLRCIYDMSFGSYRTSINFSKSKGMKFPNTGEFELPWAFVSFHDRTIELHHPNNSSDTRFNLTIPAYWSKESFNHLSISFLSVTPKPKVKAKNGIIEELLNKNDLKLFFAKVTITSENFILNECESQEYHKLLRNASYSKKDPEKILSEKDSRFLKFLSTIRLENSPITHISEALTSREQTVYEDGFIFIVNKTDDCYTLIYENEVDKRATYIFKVSTVNLQSSLNHIASFLSNCNIVNKRDKIAKNQQLIDDDNVHLVHRLFHTSYLEWEYIISSFFNP